MSEDPYEILGVSRDAGAEAIRQRYLALVRQFPPDRDPEHFARIRRAYEDVRDPIKMLNERLFSLHSADTMESLTASASDQVALRRISTKTLLLLADD